MRTALGLCRWFGAVSPGMIATGLTSPLLAMEWAVPHMVAKTPLARKVTERIFHALETVEQS